MPYRRRPYRTRRKKRRFRRKKKRSYPINRTGTVFAPRLLSGFPASIVVKLRYVETGIVLNPTAGGMDQYVFRANSVYDPDFTGLGHQPCGFDEWSSIYASYTVLGSKCRLKATNTGTLNVTPSFMGVMLSTASSGVLQYSDINNLLEGKLTGSNVQLVGDATSGQFRANNTVTKKFSASRFFGVKNVNDGATYSANIGQNPADQAYFCCWTCSPDGTSDPSAMNCTVYIDYIVMFKDPKVITGS